MSIISSLILIGVILIYGLERFNKALQLTQQSGYDLKRLKRFFKENINEVIPLHDILVFILILLKIIFEYTSDGQLLTNMIMIITIIVVLINLRFLRIAKNFYTKKKPLVYTMRVRRIIGVVIIIFLITLLFGYMPLSLSIFLLFVYFYIYAALIILEPFERKIRQKFQKQAAQKITEQSDLLVIGITGSYGKTSIKNIIYDVISSQKRTLKTPESYNTPNGLTITINKYLEKFHQVFLAEMGAYYKGDIAELAELVGPKIGIVSSIGPQHLETFGSIESIQATKMELIEALPYDGLGILNYDNQYIREYQIKNNVPIKYYSLENENVDLYICDVEYLQVGMKFTVVFDQQERIELQTKLLGKHNLYNIAAALLVAQYLEVDFDLLDDLVMRIKPIDHRLALKNLSEDLLVIDDAFNGNYEGIKEGINILNNFKEYERIVITPGIIDLGEEQYQINYNLIKETINTIDYLYVVGKTNKDALIAGAQENDNCQVYEFSNFIDAYKHAIEIQKAKAILIANDLPDKFN